MSDLDNDQSGTLTKAECFMLLSKTKSTALSTDQIIFGALDADGDGDLTKAELSKRLSELGIGKKNIETLMQQLDQNEDDRLSGAECAKFLDRTKFLDLIGPDGGFEMKGSPGSNSVFPRIGPEHRAIELRQLEKIYAFMEKSIADSDNPWMVRDRKTGDFDHLKDPKKVNLYNLQGALMSVDCVN